MNFVALKAAASRVHGTGCFAVGPIAKGTVIAFWGDEEECRFLDSAEHRKKFLGGSRLSRETAVRVLGEVYVEARRLVDKDPSDFINHSKSPNVGYYAGILFALKRIAKGQEMFLDYRLLNAQYEVNVVRGYSSKKQLKISAAQFLSALKASKR